MRRSSSLSRIDPVAPESSLPRQKVRRVALGGGETAMHSAGCSTTLPVETLS